MRDHFESQARSCDRLGSPFTARMCRLLADILDKDTATGRRALAWPGDPGANALALRLCGAMHALVLAGRDAELAAQYPPTRTDESGLRKAAMAALTRHDAFVREFIDSPPQTNEIARSAMLLPALLLVARETSLPLAIGEIGASAGLNLNLDRFHYTYENRHWGDAASPVKLSPQVEGNPPPLDATLEVVSRAGCDRMPVEISDPSQRLRLKSYLWPDQPHRMERLEAAMVVANAHPFRLTQEDAADFVDRELAGRPDNAAYVLMHSIMWQYLPEATKARIEKTLERHGGGATTTAPIAHMRMEPVPGESGHAVLSLTMWPDGMARRLARVDFHGRWIAWEG
ncbi:MAG: DUF2332 domain-containing protein [Rhizobiaceae bacterium]